MKIRIVSVEEISTEGRKFKVYKCLNGKGYVTTLKFRKEVNNTPCEPCMIEVNPENVSIDTRKQYPVVWVAKIEAIQPLDETRKQDNKKKVEDFFNE